MRVCRECVYEWCVWFFQAEDGIRGEHEGLEFRRVLFRSTVRGRRRAGGAEQAAELPGVVDRLADGVVAGVDVEQMVAAGLRDERGDAPGGVGMEAGDQAGVVDAPRARGPAFERSDEHTSELQSLMRN